MNCKLIFHRAVWLLLILAAGRFTARALPINPAQDFHFTLIPEVDFKPAGWIPCGAGADLIWDGSHVAIMRQKGKLETIFTAPADDPVAGVVADGRYGWVIQKRRLVVLDPARGVAGRVDAQAGLPPGDMMAAALAPGRVCVVGAAVRTWCATVDFVPGGQSRVDIFFEAPLRAGAWTDPHLAFQPLFIVPLRDPDAPAAPRVLVGRNMMGRGSHLPLLLDPQRRSAQLLSERCSNMLCSPTVTEHGGCAYWVEHAYDLAAQDALTPRNTAPPAWENDHLSVVVEDLNRGPNKEYVRLVRYGAPQWRKELLHNNLPNTGYRNYPEYGKLNDKLVGFLDGRCYLFLGDGIYWADLEHGRVIQLQGDYPHLGNGRNRLFHSNLYGLLAPAETDQAGYGVYQFAPTFDPARLGSIVETGKAGQRTVKFQDPLENRPVVVRDYRNWRAAPDAYTTLTAALDGQALRFEQDFAPDDAALVVLPGDQVDAEIRGLLHDSVTFFTFRGEGFTRFDDADSPRYFIWDRESLARRAPPQKMLILDALGHPLAHCEVKAGYEHNLRFQLLHSARLLIAMGRTDATGRLSIPLCGDGLSSPPGTFPRFVQISHPDYGVRTYYNWLGEWGVSPVAGEMTVTLPLVSLRTPQAARALQGTVTGREGQPIPGAQVRCIRMLSPAGDCVYLNHQAICDREGRFFFYPHGERQPEGEIGPGSFFQVEIRHPEQPDIPPYSAILDNQQPHLIRWFDGLRPHRFVIRDETRPTSGTVRKFIAYRHSNEVQALAEPFQIYNPVSRFSFTGEKLNYQDTLSPLRAGWYDVFLDNQTPLGVQVMPDSPGDIEIRVTPELLTRLRQQRAQRPAPRLATMTLADNDFKEGHYERARQAYLDVARPFPAAFPLALGAKLAAADCLYRLRQYGAFRAEAEPLLKQVVTSQTLTREQASTVRLHLAQLLKSESQWAACGDALFILLAEDPKSPTAAEAQTLLEDVLPHLTPSRALDNKLVAAFYHLQNYPREIQVLRHMLTGLQPPSREWAEAQLKLGIALEHLSPPRHKEAAEAFDAILATGLVDSNLAEHVPTKAVFWRLAIARTLGEQEKFKALIALMKTMPDNPGKKSALDRYDPKPAAR